MDPGNRRAVLAAMLANGGIAIAKFVGFGLTGASSMLAEGVHSVADTGNQALLLWGGAAAARKATPEHPFGFGRERFFWAFVVSLVLFALGSVYAIYEGVHKLMHPEPISSVGWALGILGGGIVLEGLSFRTAIIEANRQRGDLGWRAFIRETKNPELPVVLLEDLGAMLGLVLALAAVSAAVLTGDSRFDGAGSVLIGLLLGVIAVVLAVEMKSLLIGEAANERDRLAMRQAMAGHPDVSRVIAMRTEHIGPDDVLLVAKLHINPGLDVTRLTDVIDEVEQAVRRAVPSVRLIYLEPDLYEEPRA